MNKQITSTLSTKFIRSLFIILTFSLVFTALFLPTYAKSDNTITETVNLANINKNAEGNGYEWANLTDTLTLDSLNIVTDDDYGLKLPKEATVVLKGNNYISAKQCALVCTGTVTFTGSGTLTLVADNTGISCTSVYRTDLVRFTDGKINITAGQFGIQLENSDLALMGSKVTITLNGQDNDRAAISGKAVAISAGSLKANAPVYAANSLSVSAADVSVNANSPALNCPNSVTLNKVSIKAGATEATLEKVNEYTSQNVIELHSTASNAKKGILFNANYPRFLDYLIFAVVFILIVLLIVLPIYFKRKRTERLVAEYRAANETKATKKSKKNSK